MALLEVRDYSLTANYSWVHFGGGLVPGRGQPLDSLPPDELCSRKTVLRGLFGLLNGKDFRQFGEAMLYCSNWKGSDHTLGCERENGCEAGGDPCFVAQVLNTA